VINNNERVLCFVCRLSFVTEVGIYGCDDEKDDGEYDDGSDDGKGKKVEYTTIMKLCSMYNTRSLYILCRYVIPFSSLSSSRTRHHQLHFSVILSC